MAKQALKVSSFHNGLNSKTDPRDIKDDELAYIAERVSAIPSDKVGLSDVFKSAVYKKPSLIIDVLKVFAGI